MLACDYPDRNKYSKFIDIPPPNNKTSVYCSLCDESAPCPRKDVSFIKIDAEGYDKTILLSMGKVLNDGTVWARKPVDTRPIMWCEWCVPASPGDSNIRLLWNYFVGGLLGGGPDHMVLLCKCQCLIRSLATRRLQSYLLNL